MDDENLIKLDEICNKYFNIKPTVARRKAALGTLPVPAFRLTNSGRGPFFVSKDVLHIYLEKRVASAAKQHAQMANI